MKAIILSEVQPIENYLRKRTVEYFCNNSNRIFSQSRKISIVNCRGQPFIHFVADGNTRLYACSRLGIEIIPPESIKLVYEDEAGLQLALKNYEEGICNWTDLDSRLLSDEEYFYFLEISPGTRDGFEEWVKNNLDRYKDTIANYFS